MKHIKWIATCAALLLPSMAAAQAAPQPQPNTEIGIYVHHVGSAKRFVGAGGRVLAESNNFEQFIHRIGGNAADVPARNAAEEQWNAAVLNVLARHGWALVGCQLVTRINDDYMYSCYLQRTVMPDGASAPAN